MLFLLHEETLSRFYLFLCRIFVLFEMSITEFYTERSEIMNILFI